MEASAIPLGVETFIIRRAPLVTNPRNGEQTRDWSNADDTIVTGAKVNPFELSEKLGLDYNIDREFVRGSLKFYAPAGTDIDKNDRIIYLGETFSVLGEPFPWYDFEGQEHHIEIVARYQEG